MIDTQFLPSAAKELIDWVERVTQKPIELAIVLHANPDKFDGTATFQKHGIRVVTSKQVLDLIPEVHAKRTRAFYARYAQDYPKDQPKPDSFGDHDVDLSAGGVTVRAHVMGAGCSDAHVVVEWQKHVFVGDLIASQTHSWLELAHLAEWHQRLAEIKALDPKFVHPGRGPTGGPELIDAEDSYLSHFEEIVSSEQIVANEECCLDRVASGSGPRHHRGPPAPENIAHMKAVLEKEYPAYGYDVFVEMGLTAVWEQLAEK